jgi:hypothetical protein
VNHRRDRRDSGVAAAREIHRVVARGFRLPALVAAVARPLGRRPPGTPASAKGLPDTFCRSPGSQSPRWHGSTIPGNGSETPDGRKSAKEGTDLAATASSASRC